MTENWCIQDQRTNLYIKSIAIDVKGTVKIENCMYINDAMLITNPNFAIMLMHTLNCKAVKPKGKTDINYVLIYFTPIIKL